jgi:bifunctional DNA-binding transcriptional regulator/antitoxin component of YhaV-PrlF toxin-antitoxin module
MAQATLSRKNQIVVPREARQALDVKAGDKLTEKPSEGHQRACERPLSGRIPSQGTSKLGLTRLRSFLRRHRSSGIDTLVRRTTA